MKLMYSATGQYCRPGDLVPFRRELATLVEIQAPTSPRSNGAVIVKHSGTGEHTLHPFTIGAEWRGREDRDERDYGIVPTRCPNCRRIIGIEVHIDSFRAWQNGKLLVQDAFPELSSDEREALVSGTCPECWERLFSEPAAATSNEGEAE